MQTHYYVSWKIDSGMLNNMLCKIWKSPNACVHRRKSPLNCFEPKLLRPVFSMLRVYETKSM
jgi:hypothetical protein